MNKKDNQPEMTEDMLFALLGGAKPAQSEAPKIKLMTRSGSDPQFDNLAYLAKIEQQTLDLLAADLGVDAQKEWGRSGS